MKKVELYDTTLRDGSQTEGISFSAHDKVKIAQKLDVLGVHYIEGGYPGSNPKDIEFFKTMKNIKLKNSRLTAFGSTARAKTKPQDDTNIRALVSSGAKVLTIFGKTWDLHVKDVLKVSLEENLCMIYDSVKYLKLKKFKVFYDAEHFFDGYKNNPEYALKTLEAACNGGAEAIVLCDTNGGCITSELCDIIKDVKIRINTPLGIHVHNDSGMAIANSIAAVQAGCIHVQGTINGYGERCGNADLVPIIGNLKAKLGINCISDAALKHLTETARFVAEISNMKQIDNQPFVGNSAFAHKGGIHINAMMKNKLSYEHINPDIVGNKTRLLASELAGSSGIMVKARDMKLKKSDDRTQAKKILKVLQEMEHKGYQYEAAEASLRVLMRRVVGEFKRFFNLKEFRVIVEKRDKELISEATVKVKVGKSVEHTAALGDGPVNALDNALRKALSGFYPVLREMHLSDFKVRVLDEKSGTAARVRVLIESQDKKESWWTIGVSENIIEASWLALADSVEYKLLKELKKKK